MSLQDWFKAVATDNLEFVKAHWAKYACSKDASDRTGLMIAVTKKASHVLPILAHTEARVQNSDGYTALMLTVTIKNYEAMRILRDWESRLQSKAGETALTIAARLGDAKAVKLLYPYETASSSGAFESAAKAGHLEILRFLRSSVGGALQPMQIPTLEHLAPDIIDGGPADILLDLDPKAYVARMQEVCSNLKREYAVLSQIHTAATEAIRLENDLSTTIERLGARVSELERENRDLFADNNRLRGMLFPTYCDVASTDCQPAVHSTSPSSNTRHKTPSARKCPDCALHRTEIQEILQKKEILSLENFQLAAELLKTKTGGSAPPCAFNSAGLPATGAFALSATDWRHNFSEGTSLLIDRALPNSSLSGSAANP